MLFRSSEPRGFDDADHRVLNAQARHLASHVAMLDGLRQARARAPGPAVPGLAAG